MPNQSKFAQNFLSAFDQVKRREQIDEELAQRKEERAEQRHRYKMESDRLKLKDMEDARAARFNEAKAMEDLPAPPGLKPPPMAPVEGEEAERLRNADPMQVELNRPMETGASMTEDQVEGQHPIIHIPEGGYGAPPLDIRPRTREQVLRENLAAKIEQARAERAAQRVHIDDSTAEDIEVPAGDYDPEALTAIDQSRDRKQQLTTSREQNATTLAAANARAGSEDLDSDESATNYAQMLSTGEIKTLSSVPRERGFRTKVVNKMFDLHLAILTPKLEAKIDHFNEARSSLDHIADQLQSLKDAKGFKANSEEALQLEADVNGLSRAVGRAMGEKGVFTDADKADFASIMGFGAGVFPGSTAVMALITPEASEARIKKLYQLMDRVKDREITNFGKRSGGRYPAGLAPNKKTKVGDFEVEEVQ